MIKHRRTLWSTYLYR